MSILAACLVAAAAGQISIRILPAPLDARELWPIDINDEGQIAGHANDWGGARPLFWDASGDYTVIGAPGQFAFATSINASGHVALLADAAGSPAAAAWYGDGPARPLAPVAPDAAVVLTDAGSVVSDFVGDGGVVLPGIAVGGADPELLQVSQWPPDWVDARALDALGETLLGAFTSVDGRSGLFTWARGSAPRVLARFGEGERVLVVDAAPSGLVAVTTVKSSGAAHPYLWSSDDGLLDLSSAFSDRSNSRTRAVNDRGMVIGFGYPRPYPSFGSYVWTSRYGAVALTTLFPADIIRYPYVLREALDINNRGEIVARMVVLGISDAPPAALSFPPVVLTLCPADFNFDAAVTLADLIDYLAAFQEGDPYANLQDPADSPLDVRDLLAFLAAFRAGC